MAEEPNTEQRIAKLLARAGVASRREIERMIADGRVAVDGRVLDTPATLLRSLAGVAVDGQPVAAAPPARLFLHHKPPGLLVTESDPGGRPTIYDRLPPDLPRLVPVGRLDLATEGLLLLTTDGGLKRELELPATGVERAYRARAYGEITQERLEDLSEGVEIDGMRYGPINANLERRTGANTWIELILTEGKNREVRRVLEHLGLQVSRLIRTRYGPFLLGDLQPGEIGEVRQHNLVAFRRSLGKKGAASEPVSVLARPRVAGPASAMIGAEPGHASSKAGQRSPSDPPRASLGEGDQPKAGRGAGRTTSPSRPANRTAPTDRPARARPNEAERARPDQRRGEGDDRRTPSFRARSTPKPARISMIDSPASRPSDRASKSRSRAGPEHHARDSDRDAFVDRATARKDRSRPDGGGKPSTRPARPSPAPGSRGPARPGGSGRPRKR